MRLDRIAELAADNEALREQVRQFKDALGRGLRFPPEWKLTRCEAAVLGVLTARTAAQKEAFMIALYGDRDDPPDENIIRVFVCRLRRKLRAHGIAIHTMKEGWFVTAADRARLRAQAVR